MKVQLSCGVLLEVNGFLCFPVSFTITKANRVCVCFEASEHSGENPDNYSPIPVYFGNW